MEIKGRKEEVMETKQTRHKFIEVKEEVMETKQTRDLVSQLQIHP